MGSAMPATELDPEPLTADDVVDDDRPSPDPTREGPFRVHDMASAGWAVRLIRRKRDRLGEAREVARVQLEAIEVERAQRCADLDAEQYRVEQYLVDAHEDLDGIEAWLLPQLREWHREVLDADPREWARKGDKSIKLPGGTLRAKRPADEWSWGDEAAFVAWALDRDRRELVRATPSRSAVKQAGFDLDPETGYLLVPPLRFASDDGEAVPWPALWSVLCWALTGCPGEVAPEVVPGVSVAGAELEFWLETK